MFQPVAILKSHLILFREQPTKQYLVQWEHNSAANATWVTAQELRLNFPQFQLKDKSCFKEGGNVPVKGQKKESNGQKVEDSG